MLMPYNTSIGTFDVLVLDSVLDTSRDEHPDIGYHELSDELTYVALLRRVVDTATRNPPLVHKIREITAYLNKFYPDIPTSSIHEALCRSVVLECGGLAIFNYRKGSNHSSISQKHDRLNAALDEMKMDSDTINWVRGLIYAYSRDIQQLKELADARKLDMNETSSVFGALPVVAARYADEATALWCYKESSVCKTEQTYRQEFMRYVCCYGRMEAAEHILAEKDSTGGKATTFADCPRWAASWGKMEVLRLLLGRGLEICDNMEKQLEIAFLAACTHGQLDVAKYIVEEMRYVPKPGDKGKGLRHSRPLCLATQSGNVELVRWLLEFEQLSKPSELELSFKWATRYATIDMVKLYFEEGLPVDINDNEWVGGRVVRAGIDAAKNGKVEHLRFMMENGVVFRGGDEHSIIYKTAGTGAIKSLKILRELLDGYVEIAPEEFAKAWRMRNRRAMESFIEEGIQLPSWLRKERIRTHYEYERRIVPIVNWGRKKWGIWPYQWTYATQF
ncbi:hypothetical protein ABW19_dt0201317 [Dactylella cylindrospora]|nr:hypothetical protein ABW19_dt0201317 [Dactylella cylindrospora]